MQTGRALLTLSLTLGLLLAGLAALPVAMPGFARSNGAIIEVTTENPAPAADGKCALSEAIDNANADAAVHPDCPPGSGADTIVLPAGSTIVHTEVNNTIDGPNALPYINSEITIQGNGATLTRATDDETPNMRLLRIGSSGNVTIHDLTISHGKNTATDATGAGGCVLNFGRLTLEDVNVEHCQGGYGGAIFNARQLDITRGEFNYNQALANGGALYNYFQSNLKATEITVYHNSAASRGGGILNDQGWVEVVDGVVSYNTAELTGGGMLNSASGNDATTTITNTLVVSNTSAGGGAGIANFAGDSFRAVFNAWNSNISYNRSAGTNPLTAVGGGIYNSLFIGATTAQAEVYVVDSAIGHNEAVSGGGLAQFNSVSAEGLAKISLNRSLVYANLAKGRGAQTANGGGLLNSNGYVLLANTTLSANQADGSGTLSGYGGGIVNFGLSGAANLTTINITLANNTASGSGGGLANVSLGGTAAASLSNSVIAGNTATTGGGCANQGGNITSLGANLEDGNTCGLNQPSDLPDTNPILGPLQDNGGPTHTHALLANSPARNAGNGQVCAQPPIDGVDQRGVSRPQSAGCDIGAFEAEDDQTQQAVYLPLVLK